MKKSLKILSLFLTVSAFFSSCDDDVSEVVDVTAPTISNVQHPETVEPGETMILSFVLQDENALGEVRIDIHDDFDGHEHESARIKATPFEYSNVLESMRGEQEFTVEVSIAIPADAATGPYHLQINYFDALGNEGEYFISTFEISSESIMPAVTITNFGADEELEPTTNEDGSKVLYLEGTVESRTAGGLQEVHIIVQHEEEDGHSHESTSSEEPVYEQEWELGGATSFSLQDISPVIDLTTTEAGHYILSITATDVEGNVKMVSREIHLD